MTTGHVHRIIALLLICVSLAGCGGIVGVHFGGGIEGRVVDARTGEPVEDAVVVADWETYYPAMHGVSDACSLRVAETVTDAQGRFRFSWWGPRFSFAYLDDEAPRLYVLKDGYVLYRSRLLLGTSPVYPEPPPDFREIELEPFEGSPRDYRRAVDERLLADLRYEFLVDLGCHDACRWERIPEFTRRLARLSRRFRENGMSHVLPTQKELYRDGHCCNPKLTLGVTPYREPRFEKQTIHVQGVDGSTRRFEKWLPNSDREDDLPDTRTPGCPLPRVALDDYTPPWKGDEDAADSEDAIPPPGERTTQLPGGTEVSSPKIHAPPSVSKETDPEEYRRLMRQRERWGRGEETQKANDTDQ